MSIGDIKVSNGEVQFLQGFDDIEPVPVDVLIETVVVDRITESDGSLYVSAPDEHVSILDTQSGVVPDSGEQHETTFAVKHIEVRAVVEVAVRGGRRADGNRRLVDGVFVKRTQDQRALPIKIRCGLYCNYENRSAHG